MTSATPRQRAVLAFIAAFAAEHRAQPRLIDIMNRFGFKSKSAAHGHVEALRRLGLIRKLPKVARGIAALSVPSMPAIAVPRHPFASKAARHARDHHLTIAKTALLYGVPRADAFAAYAELYPETPRIAV